MNLNLISIILFFTMFFYSGFPKIYNFTKKVNVLQSKTNLPLIINKLGMIGVILLEIIGSLIIIMYEYNPNIIPKNIAKLTYLLFLAFLIVVTFLYHPPWGKQIIPFLSNLTTFAGLLYIYNQKF